MPFNVLKRAILYTMDKVGAHDRVLNMLLAISACHCYDEN